MRKITIKKLNEDRIKEIENCMNQISRNFPSLIQEFIPNAPQYLYHYTSFEKLFSVLDGDALWASRSRFSNDSTEDQIFGKNWLKKEQYYGDNYILCFSDNDDILSQWRGYCPQGGVSIGFRFPEGYQTYTLLHSNHNEKLALTDKQFELYKNRSFPVIYCPKHEESVNDKIARLLNFLETEENINVNASDIVPYLKNILFHEEREYRLVFNNTDNELEKCIRFRKNNDGSMIPYIVIKFGDFLESGRTLSTTYDETLIDDIFEERINFKKSVYREPIIIPQGKDQSKICNLFSQRIRKYKKSIFEEDSNSPEQERYEDNPIELVCEGHLPIVSITVSPSPQQEYMKEVIERFCKSKYWLQNIKVKCSRIPYIAPKL